MKLEHHVDIQAPRDAVWAVTVNVQAWPEWTPTVRFARALGEGPFGVGSRFVLKQPLQPETTWEVVACVPGESFTWETRGASQLMRATHQLEAREGVTRNTLILEAPDVTGVLRRALLKPVFAMALAKENTGLKRFCER